MSDQKPSIFDQIEADLARLRERQKEQKQILDDLCRRMDTALQPPEKPKELQIAELQSRLHALDQAARRDAAKTGTQEAAQKVRTKLIEEMASLVGQAKKQAQQGKPALLRLIARTTR